MNPQKDPGKEQDKMTHRITYPIREGLAGGHLSVRNNTSSYSEEKNR